MVNGASDKDRIDALKVAGDWSLRLLLSEGDRFWTRVQHCLASNSLLAVALAAILASSSPHLHGTYKLTAACVISLTACVLNILWLRIARRGSAWHRIYGYRFSLINKRLVQVAGLDIPTAHPEGAFPKYLQKGKASEVKEGEGEKAKEDGEKAKEEEGDEMKEARGIQRTARGLIAVAATLWALAGISALVAVLHYVARLF